MKIEILSKILIILFISIFLKSCGGLPKAGDARTMEMEGEERARKNIEEGKGWSLRGATNAMGKTTYEFSTSNPMWRASLETLDFLPLTTVDYSGGVIISDWYSDSNNNEAVKISIRFLSNEIRSDSLKIIVHKKTCSNDLNCRIKLLSSTKIKDELYSTILNKASLLEKQAKEKK